MLLNPQLEPLQATHHFDVRSVYSDAIQTQAFSLYTHEQICAWSALAWLPGVLDKPLQEGRGWISIRSDQIEAFGLRYPSDRLALLYCRGRSANQGHATALLDRIELEAMEEGQIRLVTEASLFSYSLLLKRGWIIRSSERIQIGGVGFKRFLMEKFFE